MTEDGQVRGKVVTNFSILPKKAITTIVALLSNISIKKKEKFLMKMIENFVTMESFTSKIAAAKLIPVIYSDMQSSSQRTLISFYIKMA
jgi:hypothetical protein